MNINKFDYHLPRELIAQYPIERGKDRLLVVNKLKQNISHKGFGNLLDYLHKDDLLVLNDTRVIHARLLGRKTTGGKVEVFLVKRVTDVKWHCLIKASKAPREGMSVLFDEGLSATIEKHKYDGYEVSFSDSSLLKKVGRIPLPPYIQRPAEQIDETSYQTVYARYEGSVAAPTAGLHFTREFLQEIQSHGVGLAYITLHVGPGTFVPVRTQRIEDHTMHSEDFCVSYDAAETINNAFEEGKRIVAVGTTTCRVLEHLMIRYGKIVAGSESTDLFIYPGFSFRCVGALLTNFHLPCSTLLMLVTAFGGYDIIMNAYKQAVERKYRFFSYGDAMFIF